MKRRFDWLAVPLTGLLLLTATHCANPGGRQKESASSSEELENMLRDAVSQPVPEGERDLRERNVAPPRLDWPGGWRLVDQGRFGTRRSPVIWYQLEAGDIPLDEAASVALETLRPLAGTISFEEVTFLPGEKRAVAQVRGALARGAIESRSQRETTTVRVILETKAGVRSPRRANSAAPPG